MEERRFLFRVIKGHRWYRKMYAFITHSHLFFPGQSVFFPNKAKSWPISAPRLIKNLWINIFKWMNEWMNKYYQPKGIKWSAVTLPCLSNVWFLSGSRAVALNGTKSFRTIFVPPPRPILKASSKFCQMAQIWSESRYQRPQYMMDLRPELGFSGQIWAILLGFGPLCLDLGHFA